MTGPGCGAIWGADEGGMWGCWMAICWQWRSLAGRTRDFQSAANTKHFCLCKCATWCQIPPHIVDVLVRVHPPPSLTASAASSSRPAPPIPAPPRPARPGPAWPTRAPCVHVHVGIGGLRAHACLFTVSSHGEGHGYFWLLRSQASFTLHFILALPYKLVFIGKWSYLIIIKIILRMKWYSTFLTISSRHTNILEFQRKFKLNTHPLTMQSP